MKEVFCLFDRDADGLIHINDIPTLIRSLGVNPTEQELMQMFKGKEDSSLTFDEFVKLVGPKCGSVDQQAELNKAFKTFDRDNNGTVSTGELKHVLLNLGEKLSEDEVTELMAVADPNQSGNIKYKEFVAQLCGGK